MDPWESVRGVKAMEALSSLRGLAEILDHMDKTLGRIAEHLDMISALEERVEEIERKLAEYKPE